MNISTQELRTLLINAASKVVSKEEAEYFADENIETHIRKAPRSNALKSAIADIKHSQNAKEEISYKVDLPAFTIIDFHSHGPLVHMKKIHDHLEERSSKNGVAMVGFTNSKSMHTLHAWVQGLAKRGMMAIAINNGGPNAVIPHNGTKGLFGTNPMAFGVPNKDGSIHCVDMAMSQVPYFDILNAKADEKDMEEGTMVDQSGEPSTDPIAGLDYSKSETDPISNLTPIGNTYKGYYLIYLFELLTSALVGMPSSPEMSTDYVAEEHGSLLMVFNLKALNTQSAFYATVQKIHKELAAQTPREGHTIRIPGQGNNEKAENMPSEIDVADATLEILKELSR